MKRNIQDWHLMLIVLTLLLISTSIFCLYILLQGTIAKFTVDKNPHKEKPFRIEGVRKYIKCYNCGNSIIVFMTGVTFADKFLRLFMFIHALDSILLSELELCILGKFTSLCTLLSLPDT